MKMKESVLNHDSVFEEKEYTYEIIDNFQCAVHRLLQFSYEVEKVLKKYEKKYDIYLKFGCFKGESVYHLFILLISKLFFKDGTGDPCLIKVYMRKYVKESPLLNFKGNRLNVVFYNAAEICMLHPYLISYLENMKTSLNSLQETILQGLKMPN